MRVHCSSIVNFLQYTNFDWVCVLGSAAKKIRFIAFRRLNENALMKLLLNFFKMKTKTLSL